MLEDGTRNHDNAKVGQSFAIKVRNVSAFRKRAQTHIKKVIKDIRGFKAEVEEEVERRSIRKEVLKTAFEIWEVIQPCQLLSYMGVWSRNTWIPEILINGRWIKASDEHCMNWLNIPKDERRVIMFQGIIEE